jgi:molecular chaperone DnaK
MVEMKSAVDVDDAAVQRMVEESVEHAFEDLAVRRWVEGTLRAREALAATRKGLADCAGEIEADYRARLESAMGKVEAALATERADTKTGDTAALTLACSALDEETRPLADLLMDKAMEAMLRKRGLLKD